MLLPVAHDYAEPIRLSVDGLSVPVHRSTVQDDLFLPSATRTRCHRGIITLGVLDLKITPTVLGASSAVITPGYPNTVILLTGVVIVAWGSPAGYEITLSLDTAKLEAGCASAKGIKKLTLNDNGGGNLEIGPAF